MLKELHRTTETGNSEWVRLPSLQAPLGLGGTSGSFLPTLLPVQTDRKEYPWRMPMELQQDQEMRGSSHAGEKSHHSSTRKNVWLSFHHHVCRQDRTEHRTGECRQNYIAWTTRSRVRIPPLLPYLGQRSSVVERENVLSPLVAGTDINMDRANACRTILVAGSSPAGRCRRGTP